MYACVSERVRKTQTFFVLLDLLQVKYKKDFEESKGRGFSIVSDTPEMQRLRRTQEQISIVCSHTHSHTICAVFDFMLK